MQTQCEGVNSRRAATSHSKLFMTCFMEITFLVDYMLANTARVKRLLAQGPEQCWLLQLVTNESGDRESCLRTKSKQQHCWEKVDK